jgi:hypothetical protein
MVAGYSENRFMVTSRIVGYDVSPLTREFKHATLNEMSPELDFIHSQKVKEQSKLRSPPRECEAYSAHGLS